MTNQIYKGRNNSITKKCIKYLKNKKNIGYIKIKHYLKT